MADLKEVKAHIKTYELPEKAGWWFFDDENVQNGTVIQNNLKLPSNNKF